VAADSIVRVVGDARLAIVARSPTLDGNVPLRAARACPPFLRGNGVGWILRTREPIRLRRRFRSIEVEPPVRRARILGSDEVELTLDSGFWLEHTMPGVAMVVERAHNLRDRRVDVVACRADLGAPFELCLRVRLSRADGEATLSGDLATVTPIVLAPPIRVQGLADARDVAEAHLAFFDAEYFAAKRGAPTRKYRGHAGTSPATRPDLVGALVVHAGGAAARVAKGALGAVEVTLPAELASSLTYEGLRVAPTLDARALARRSASIEATWRAALGDAAVDAAPGALRYFTTYVTPHAPGDPHVFWKPATLIATSPDLAMIVDGPSVPGLEGMRGVVEAHWFHALPAVAEMIAPRAHLPAGERVVRARFTPSELDLRLRR
jgi:hypothetical protein